MNLFSRSLSRLPLRPFVSATVFALTFSAWTAYAQNAGGPGVSSATSSGNSPIEREQYKETKLLQRHKPFYFAYGDPNSKLQLSFKVPLLTKYPLYFGYTQLMFWALNKNSMPFHDQTFSPELFYRFYLDESNIVRSIDAGFWGHNSNGKGGDVSRSYNTRYVRLNMEKEGRNWTTRANVQLQYLFGYDETNREVHENNKQIKNYVGPLSVNLTFVQLFDGWFDKSEISLSLTPGGKLADRWDHGGYQASWSFRLGAINLTPAFYLQYYHGYAETLLNYNQRVDEFRGGVVF